MTDLQPLADSGGLYTLPTDARWLATLLGKPLASRANLFIALNEACAAIAADSDDQARASLAAALGLPRPAQWHNDSHPLRSPAAARSACDALLAAGYQP